MSYDFSLHRPSERRQGLKDSFESQGDPDPALEQRKQRLAAQLIQLNPSLSIFPLRFAELARWRKITEDEARRRFRYLELNGPRDGNGIQIRLYDRSASATLPYWHSGEKALEVLKELWAYFRLLASDGFVIHDDQLCRTLDLDQDFDAVVESYADGVTFTRTTMERARRGEVDPG